MFIFNPTLLHLERRLENRDKPLLFLLKLRSESCGPHEGPAEKHIFLVAKIVKLRLEFLLSCQVLNAGVRILLLSSEKSTRRRIELVQISIMLREGIQVEIFGLVPEVILVKEDWRCDVSVTCRHWQSVLLPS